MDRKIYCEICKQALRGHRFRLANDILDETEKNVPRTCSTDDSTTNDRSGSSPMFDLIVSSLYDYEIVCVSARRRATQRSEYKVLSPNVFNSIQRAHKIANY